MGKCLSSSWRKSWPNFVLRDDEKGGLYQRIFFFFLVLLFLLLWVILELWLLMGEVGVARGCVKVTGSDMEGGVWLFWLAVWCVALSRRRCERRSCVVGSCSEGMGGVDGLVLVSRSGFWLG